MQRSAALDAVRSVLDKIRGYVEEHGTFNDSAELNAKYVPAALQDEITWVAERAERLLGADPPPARPRRRHRRTSAAVEHHLIVPAAATGCSPLGTPQRPAPTSH